MCNCEWLERSCKSHEDSSVKSVGTLFVKQWCDDKCGSVLCQSVFGDGENTKVRVSELEEEVKTLKKINKDLYEFSTQLLTKPN